MKVLITGFDPFGGEAINPAFEAVKLIPDSIEGASVVKLEVPTVFGKSVDVLVEEIKKEQPDVVICVGQAGGRFNLNPEVVAINKDAARIPDNEGNSPADCQIREDGENAYFSTLPYKAMVQAMNEGGIPAQLSYTAGTYVCNHIFYGLMYNIAKKFPKIRGGFIHVPYAAEQVLDKKNTPFMPLNSIAKGLELSVGACVKNEKDIEIKTGTTH